MITSNVCSWTRVRKPFAAGSALHLIDNSIGFTLAPGGSLPR